MRARAILLAAMLLCTIGCANAKPKKEDDSQAMADRIVESHIPVFIDFWAVWCPACRMQEGRIAELEKEYKGRVLFMRADVDIHHGLTQYFRVTAMPTVFIIEDKTVRSAFQGMRDKQEYRVALDKAIAQAAERNKAAPPADKGADSKPPAPEKGKK